MTRPKKLIPRTVIEVSDPETLRGRPKHVGGSCETTGTTLSPARMPAEMLLAAGYFAVSRKNQARR
jgi:hypothetical protein